MKKIILTVICLLLLVGCGNTLYNDTEKTILNDGFATTKEKVKNLINDLEMFPKDTDEDLIITYLEVIRDHKDEYTKEELQEIKMIITSHQYSFGLNSLGYTRDDIDKLINEL